MPHNLGLCRSRSREVVTSREAAAREALRELLSWEAAAMA
jgi:hypothetical protein